MSARSANQMATMSVIRPSVAAEAKVDVASGRAGARAAGRIRAARATGLTRNRRSAAVVQIPAPGAAGEPAQAHSSSTAIIAGQASSQVRLDASTGTACDGTSDLDEGTAEW